MTDNCFISFSGYFALIEKGTKGTKKPSFRLMSSASSGVLGFRNPTLEKEVIHE